MTLTSRLQRLSCAFTVLIAALGGAALATPARAATTTSYAALGDSYSAGVGADDYSALSGICSRSSHSYPVLWAKRHTTGSFAFAACGGATTDTVLAGQLGVLDASTSLVTITVGGNDAGFLTVITACTLGSAADCASTVAAVKRYARTTLPGKLATTYARIRAAASNADLVVLGYPRLFETTASCGPLGMSLANRVAINDGADALDAVIRTQATEAGATYVSVQSQFEGHRICAATPWINGPVALLTDSYHPNASGYRNGYLPALETVTG